MHVFGRIDSTDPVLHLVSHLPLPTLIHPPLPPRPIHPTALILAHDRIPPLDRQLRRHTTPDPGFTIKHHLLVRLWLGEPKPVLELVGGQQQRVRLRGYRDVDRGRDEACVVLGGLADVD